MDPRDAISVVHLSRDDYDSKKKKPKSFQSTAFVTQQRFSGVTVYTSPFDINYCSRNGTRITFSIYTDSITTSTGLYTVHRHTAVSKSFTELTARLTYVTMKSRTRRHFINLTNKKVENQICP